MKFIQSQWFRCNLIVIAAILSAPFTLAAADKWPSLECRSEPDATCLAEAAVALGKAVPNPSDQIETLASMAADFSGAGLDEARDTAVDTALETALAIEDLEQRVSTLSVITETLAVAGADAAVGVALEELLDQAASLGPNEPDRELRLLVIGLSEGGHRAPAAMIASHVDPSGEIGPVEARMMAELLARAGMPDQALALVPLEGATPNTILRVHAIATAAQGKTDEALAMVERARQALLEDELFRERADFIAQVALETMVAVLAENGRDDDARQILDAMGDQSTLTPAVVPALVELGFTDRAISTAEAARIHGPNPLFDPRDVLAALLDAGAIETAVAFADAVEEPPDRAAALAFTAEVIAKKGDEPRAREILTAAGEVLPTLPPRDAVAATLLVAKAMARAGALEEAAELETHWRANVIASDRDVLRAELVVISLMRNGVQGLDDSLAAVRDIDETTVRYGALREIAIGLAEIDEEGAARLAVDAMIEEALAAEEPGDRAYALALGATAMAALTGPH